MLADDAALRALLPRRLMPYREAAQAAFEAERDHWSAAEGLAPSDPADAEARAGAATGAPWTEGSMLYRRNRPDFAFYAKHMSGEAEAEAPASAVWDVVSAIGGPNGYYFLDLLWVLRARLDEFAGGSGLKRGRRDLKELVVGDAVDFWRVAALEPGRRLTLLAEMKMPGSASLAFEVHALGERRSRVVATASFHPAGVKGLLYGHALAPVHAVIFPGLARAIAHRAEAASRAAGAVASP